MSAYRLRPAACFHAFTPLYDLGCTLLGYGRSFKEWVAAHGSVQPGHRVLDVGAGTGVLAGVLLERVPGLRLTLVDPDRRALRIAGAKRVRGRASLVVAVGERLPFRDASFDRVFSSLAVHHVPDAFRGALFAEVRRVLVPDGEFVYADFENHRRAWIPRRFASERRLVEWLAGAGFEIRARDWRRGVHLFRAAPASTPCRTDGAAIR